MCCRPRKASWHRVAVALFIPLPIDGQTSGIGAPYSRPSAPFDICENFPPVDGSTFQSDLLTYAKFSQSTKAPNLMNSALARITLFSVIQIIAVTTIWFFVVVEWRWDVIQQFLGHLGPGAFLVGMGVAVFFFRHDMRTLIRYEALLAMIAGAAYVLADTFIMHPPWGIFSGPGQAEQEHVSIMALVFVLGLCAMVALRKFPNHQPSSIFFFIGIAVVALVFASHPQHTVTGGIGHYGTMLFLGGAVIFRMLEKHIEYAIAMIVSGFVFFGAQTGMAEYVDTVGNSPSAWIALWATLGFVSATGFLAIAPGEEKITATE